MLRQPWHRQLRLCYANGKTRGLRGFPFPYYHPWTEASPKQVRSQSSAALISKHNSTKQFLINQLSTSDSAFGHPNQSSMSERKANKTRPPLEEGFPTWTHLSHNDNLPDVMRTFDPSSLYPMNNFDLTLYSHESLLCGQVQDQESDFELGTSSIYTSPPILSIGPAINETGHHFGDGTNCSPESSTITSPLGFSFSPVSLGFQDSTQEFLFPSHNIDPFVHCKDIFGYQHTASLIPMQGTTQSHPTSGTSFVSDQHINVAPSELSNTINPAPRWKCGDCGRDLKTKRDLHRHIDARHPQTAVKMGIKKERTQCRYCKRSFARPDHYKRHLSNKHSGSGASRG